MRWKVIALVSAILILSFVGAKVISNSKTDYEEGRILVSLRKMGHKILLQYGDSTSRILPVERLDDHTYLVKFENSFSFVPDSLIKIVDQYAEADRYLVEVINEKNEMVNYSYEIADVLNTVVPCVGRAQPEGSYYLKIHFKENSKQDFILTYVFPYLFLPIAVVILITGFRASRKKTLANQFLDLMPEDETSIHLGDFTFSMKNQVLKKGAERIELSAKEAKILSLFAAHPNEILDRDDLLKEVWENEGVFVGRSLDVFVSKLRKKLHTDSKIRIVNIHGRGYKLEVLDCEVRL